MKSSIVYDLPNTWKPVLSTIRLKEKPLSHLFLSNNHYTTQRYATDSLFDSVPLLDKIIKGFRSEKLTGLLSKGNPGPLCASEEGHLGIEASCVLLLSLNQASGATAYAYKLSQDVLTNWKNKESCSVGKLEHFPIEFWKKSVIVLLFLYCALWLIRKSRDLVSCNFPRSIKRIQSAFKFSFPFKGKEVTMLSVPCRHSIE